MTGPTDISAQFTDELVVSLRHADLVIPKLVELHAWQSADEVRVEPDERLGLALLTGFTGLAEAATAVRAAQTTDLAAAEAAEQRAFVPVEVLLYELRRQLRADLAGYVPPLGKNRIDTSIVGWSYEKPMVQPHPLAAHPPLAAAAAGGPVPDPYRDPHAGPHPAAAPHGPVPDPYRDPHIGVLDGPLTAHHAFSAEFLASLDLPPAVAGASLPELAGHATFVVDLIRQQAPGAVLFTETVLDAATGTGTVWNAATAMLRLADQGLDILNLSFGCLTEDGRPPLVLQTAIDLLPANLVVVAAAGNHGMPDLDGRAVPVSPAWPAAFDRVLAVGSTSAELLSWFSAYGPWVGATARGEQVSAAYPVDLVDGRFTGHAEWSGTSFAAATASGAIAARMVADTTVTAREALARLLDDPTGPVRRLGYQRPGPETDRDA